MIESLSPEVIANFQLQRNIIVFYFIVSDSTIALQNQNGECSSIWDPVTRQLKDRDYYTIVSHTTEQVGPISTIFCTFPKLKYNF